jgi:hypothetical protein
MDVEGSTFTNNTSTNTEESAAADLLLFESLLIPIEMLDWANHFDSWADFVAYTSGGGGITNAGPGVLTVRDSIFTDNSSVIGGGSIWAHPDFRDVWCASGEDYGTTGRVCRNQYHGNTPPQYFESCALIYLRAYFYNVNGTERTRVGLIPAFEIPRAPAPTLSSITFPAGIPAAGWSYDSHTLVQEADGNWVIVVNFTPVTAPPPCPCLTGGECNCPEGVCTCDPAQCTCDPYVPEEENGDDEYTEDDENGDDEDSTSDTTTRTAGAGPSTGEQVNFFAQIAAAAALVVTFAVAALARTREQS